MENFRFANPLVLLLLLIIPILAGLYIWRERQGRLGTMRFSSIALLSAKVRYQWRVWGRHSLIVARLLAVTLLIITLARPQTGHSRQIIRGEGVDIILTMDISGSMAAEDFQPQNRLEVAKEVAKEFVLDREYDRIGLVVYALYSFTQCPLTVDYDVLTRLIDEVELAPDLGVEDGTAIGTALATATARLRNSTADSKMIILLTDGVNNAGAIDPLTAAEAAKTLGIKIYTIGAGTTGTAPMPVDDPIWGERYVNMPTELDEETLRGIANTTDGLYFRATDAEALRQIYERISELEKTEVEIKKFTRYKEWSVVLGFPALVLLLLEMLLARTVFRKLP